MNSLNESFQKFDQIKLKRIQQQQIDKELYINDLTKVITELDNIASYILSSNILLKKTNIQDNIQLVNDLDESIQLAKYLIDKEL